MREKGPDNGARLSCRLRRAILLPAELRVYGNTKSFGERDVDFRVQGIFCADVRSHHQQLDFDKLIHDE